MVQWHVFLKGAGDMALVLFKFLQGLSFLHLEITLPFAKLSYAFEDFFFGTIILGKKIILSCLKINLKISHKLR